MNKILSKIIPLALAASLLVACGNSDASQAQAGITDATSSPAQTSTIVNIGTTTDTPVTATSTAIAVATVVVTNAAAENDAAHLDAEDTTWDSGDATRIVLDGDSITVTGDGATAEGSQVTINAAGTYEISGALTDGQIIVNTDDKEPVKLILNGVEINNSTGAPINIAEANEAAIILADGSANYLSDGESYAFPSADVDEPNAALFSKVDLTIGGSGSLTVEANYNDGIASKDGLAVTGGDITITAVDDGMRGKDYLVVKDGTLIVKAGGDGLKADNEEDATLGYVSIENGVFDIDAGGDAITGESDVLILDGDFNLTSGGGSATRIDETLSAKAIKAGADLSIAGGTFVIDAADDAIHSNTNVVINDGIFTIATGDDGVHADANLEINGGQLDITESYEGIESAVITINGGESRVVSSDDGINVAGDNDGMAMGGGGGQDAFSTASGQLLTINGGYVYVNANGDGVDVNGAINMTDGVVIVNGPTQQMNGALDYDGEFAISGGMYVAVGSSGMAQTADATSTQNALLLNLNGTLPAGTLLNIRSSDGKDILTFAPAKDIQSIALSSPELTTGTTYEVSYGGQSTGEAADGLYPDGTYSGGTAYTTFTVENIVTAIGNVGRFGGGGGRRP